MSQKDYRSFFIFKQHDAWQRGKLPGFQLLVLLVSLWLSAARLRHLLWQAPAANIHEHSLSAPPNWRSSYEEKTAKMKKGRRGPSGGLTGLTFTCLHSHLFPFSFFSLRRESLGHLPAHRRPVPQGDLKHGQHRPREPRYVWSWSLHQLMKSSKWEQADGRSSKNNPTNLS